MELSKGTKATLWLGGLCLAVFVFMLWFRAFVYPNMYLAPGDPYGISDIIEFLIFVVFLALLLVSVLAAFYLLLRGQSQSKKSAIGLLVLCTVLFFSHSPLRNIVARWAL